MIYLSIVLPVTLSFRWKRSNKKIPERERECVTRGRRKFITSNLPTLIEEPTLVNLNFKN